MISYDGISVQLVPSNKYAVKVSGDEIDKLITQVTKNTLKIKMNLGSNFKGDDYHVIVYYIEDLQEIKACEGSSITSNQTIKGHKLELNSKEGAEINLKIEVDELTSKSYTGGIIEIEGESKNINVEVYTGGQYDGKNFKSKFADAKVSAGGKLEVNVSDDLEASVSMGGNIYYYGDTQHVNTKISLGGNIESR